jgi:hypothetical protein
VGEGRGADQEGAGAVARGAGAAVPSMHDDVVLMSQRMALLVQDVVWQPTYGACKCSAGSTKWIDACDCSC